jgi:carboxymethylenebutenolidase
MIEKQIDIPTRDGAMTTLVCHLERGGPHPAVIFYMDAPGIREELRDMARRLGTAGYYVMLPNLYYRAGTMELGAFTGEANAPVRARMMELMGSLTIPLIMDDTDALIACLDADPAAGKGPIGAVGYCMSGQFAISAAARYPDRVGAAASLYGVRLVTDQADSPHLTAARAKAELYVGCAESDHWAPLEMVETLRCALADCGANAEVEVYPGVEHGFAFPGRDAYDRAAAERHWERLLALFGRRLAA